MKPHTHTTDRPTDRQCAPQSDLEISQSLSLVRKRHKQKQTESVSIAHMFTAKCTECTTDTVIFPLFSLSFIHIVLSYLFTRYVYICFLFILRDIDFWNVFCFGWLHLQCLKLLITHLDMNKTKKNKYSIWLCKTNSNIQTKKVYPNNFASIQITEKSI